MAMFIDIILTVICIAVVAIAPKRNTVFWIALSVLVVIVMQYMLMRYAGIQFSA